MKSLYNVLSWLVDNRLGASALIFLGAAIVVMVYTYFVDYRMLSDQE